MSEIQGMTGEVWAYGDNEHGGTVSGGRRTEQLGRLLYFYTLQNLPKSPISHFMANP